LRANDVDEVKRRCEPLYAVCYRISIMDVFIAQEIGSNVMVDLESVYSLRRKTLVFMDGDDSVHHGYRYPDVIRGCHPGYLYLWKFHDYPDDT
jgi:hypothetical protein